MSRIPSPLSLKTFDPDRFLLSFFVRDDEQRSAVVAVDSLNYEISRLRDVIDTPHMGLIRLQWWRDEIKKIYAGMQVFSHPVMDGLAGVVSHYQISFDDFEKLLSAREADFEEYEQFDIYGYARSIHAPLLQIKCKILGECADVSHLAEAFALIGLVRAIPFYKARTQVLLPKVSPDAVKSICDKATYLLSADRTAHKYFKAHRVLAELYLKQIEKAGYNPEKLYPLPFKELRVWWGTR